MVWESSDDQKESNTKMLADRLHSVSIRLLRSVREADKVAGISPSRLSALSVLVYGGPMRISDLAKAEGVRPPTMTRLVQAMEAEGLVEGAADQKDKRVRTLKSTRKGKRLLEKAREKRLEKVEQILSDLAPGDLKHLEKTLEALGGIFNC